MKEILYGVIGGLVALYFSVNYNFKTKAIVHSGRRKIEIIRMGPRFIFAAIILRLMKIDLIQVSRKTKWACIILFELCLLLPKLKFVKVERKPVLLLEAGNKDR
jgi:hypothetical protein